MIAKLKAFLPAALFFSFIIWMIAEADLNKSNYLMAIGHSVPYGDKIGHFLLFGILALLLNMAFKFRQIKVWIRHFHVGSLWVFVFAFCEEISQLAIDSRTFDTIDMLFDLFGIGVFSSVAFRRYLVKKVKGFADYLSESLLVDKKSDPT